MIWRNFRAIQSKEEEKLHYIEYSDGNITTTYKEISEIFNSKFVERSGPRVP